MMTTSILLSATLFLAACGDSGTSAKSTANTKADHSAVDKPSPAPPAPTQPSTTANAESWSGLVKLPAVAALPASETQIDVPGYPGSKFHMGTIDDPAAWSAMAKAGGIDGLDAVDFSSQRIVYAVLDAQTNSLGDPAWSIEGAKATLSFQWDGIEPHYEDATPGVFMAVPKAGYDSIAFTPTGGATLATVDLD